MFLKVGQNNFQSKILFLVNFFAIEKWRRIWNLKFHKIFCNPNFENTTVFVFNKLLTKKKLNENRLWMKMVPWINDSFFSTGWNGEMVKWRNNKTRTHYSIWNQNVTTSKFHKVNSYLGCSQFLRVPQKRFNVKSNTLDPDSYVFMQQKCPKMPT